jgi:hypothetical protein
MSAPGTNLRTWIDRLDPGAGGPADFRKALLIPTGRGPARLESAQADFQRRDFAALDPALAALAAGAPPLPARFWLERTKGASKDTDAAVMLLWLLAYAPRPLACQVGAADQDQAAELRKACQDLLRLNPWLAGSVSVRQWEISNPASGSYCEIIAADVAGSHGARPDLLILNELTHVTKEDFALNLLDNASKVPGGLVLVLTNAGFEGTWQHRLRGVVRGSDRWYYSEVTAPAPWLDPREVAEARRRSSGTRFRRLWGGEWVSASGDALDEADVKAAATLPGPPAGPVPGLVFYAGLDLGVSKHHAALAVVGRDRLRRLRLVRLQSWKPPAGGKVDLASVRLALLEAHRAYQPLFLFDPWQTELLAQDLKRLGVRVELQPFTGASLSEMAAGLIEAFSGRQIDIWPDPELLEDLKGLSVVEGPAGWRLAAPRTSAGGHADRAVALVLAVLASRRHPWEQPPVEDGAGGALVLTPGYNPSADWGPGFGPAGGRTGAMGDWDPPGAAPRRERFLGPW